MKRWKNKKMAGGIGDEVEICSKQHKKPQKGKLHRKNYGWGSFHNFFLEQRFQNLIKNQRFSQQIGLLRLICLVF